MTEPSFDPRRSDAIRAVLIETVEQTPARDHRRHIRIVVLAILAALGIGIGSSAVAVALSGIDLFPPAATEAAPDPSTTASPTPTPTAVPTATASPHPLVVTGDPIAPRDVLTEPAADPAWSIDVPGAGDPCQPITVIDVSDGYALIQSGPTTIPDDVRSSCSPTETRLSLSLVDTSDGVVSWTRDWAWPFDQTRYPSAQVELLGTSGRVLVETVMQGMPSTSLDPSVIGPTEVIDLATGQTLAAPVHPDGRETSSLQAVAGPSGDVIAVRKARGVDGAVISTSVDREDPRDPTHPRWSQTFASSTVWVDAPDNDSSVLPIRYTDGAQGGLRVVDIDSGGVMREGPSDRTYTYLDGVTLRLMSGSAGPTSVAGIDAAGNEFWSRSDPDGLGVVAVISPVVEPGSPSLPTSDVILRYPDGRLELVDGLTGATRWTADGSACTSVESFRTSPDGRLIQWIADIDTVTFEPADRVASCAFTADGSLVDAVGRPDPQPDRYAPRGWAAAYSTVGAWATGGEWTYKYRSPEGTVPTATVRDAVTGEVLWTRTVASDERWAFAGGYLVGISGGTVFGIG